MPKAAPLVPTNHGPGKVCDQFATEILNMVAAGKSSAQIATALGLSASTIREWTSGGCGEQWLDGLARARKAAALHRVEEAAALIDAVDPEGKSGNARVSKAREQVNFRKWLAGCLDRETFGERQQLDVKGSLEVGAFSDLVGPVIEAQVTRTHSDAETSELGHVAAPDALPSGEGDD